MKKENKKTVVFYDEAGHHLAMSQTDESVQTFKRAKTNLEAIIKKPISDYMAFRRDVLGYSIREIKSTFPKPFELGLSDEATLTMLSIDLKQLKEDAEFLQHTPYEICICPETGIATPSDCKEPFTDYITSDEQHERLDFANDLIAKLEKCHEYSPYRGKHNLVNGLIQFVYLDPQKGLVPNHSFLLRGIQN